MIKNKSGIITDRLAHELLEVYPAYCTEDSRKRWVKEVKEYIEEEDIDASVMDMNKYVLFLFNYAGHFMQMMAEKKSWKEIKDNFFGHDYEDLQTETICSIILEYAPKGVEFVEEVFGDEIPDNLKKDYEDAKEERSQNKKPNSFNFRQFMVHQFGTIDKEEIIKRSREELLEKDTDYCDEKEKTAWGRDVEEFLRDAEAEPDFLETSGRRLTSYLCAGKFMKMVAENKSWDEIRYAFFENDFPDAYVLGICQNMMSYSSDGAGFVRNIYGDNIPDYLKRSYDFGQQAAKPVNKAKQFDVFRKGGLPKNLVK